jgi:hypothetical protein
MFFTVIAWPDAVSAPFHSWVMVCPLASVKRTVQAVMAAVLARTVISAWKLPGHEFVIAIVAVQAPGTDVVVVVVGGLVVVVVVTGGVVGPLVGVVVGPPTGGTRAGCRMLYFCWLMEYQSSSAMPPVSPEFGFHDQYVKDIPFAFM